MEWRRPDPSRILPSPVSHTRAIGDTIRMFPSYRVAALVQAAVLLVATSGVARAGVVSITGGAPGNFSATLSGATQTAYSTLATYSASDATGTGLGWNVTVQSTQFTCSAGTGSCPSGGASLPASSLLMAPWGTGCSKSPTVTVTSGTRM